MSALTALAQPALTRSYLNCSSKYPPAEPGALLTWPLEAAVGAANAAP